MRRWQFFVLDLVMVVLFAAVGRRSHSEAGAVSAVLGTAWPFLAGAVVGWLIALAARLDPTTVRGGVPVWLSAVVVGMALRVLTGAGTAVTFVLVSLVVLALVLLLPRVVAGEISHRQPTRT